MDPALGVPGVSNGAPGSIKHAIWGLVHWYCPQNEEDLKYSQKTRVFFYIFFNSDGFLKFVTF